MGRLTSLKSGLGALPSSVAYMPKGERERDRARDAQAWRRWYKTARWQALRWSVLVRDLFTCQRCGEVVGDSAKLVADHRKPHRGDETLFWDEDNLQALCKPCHDGDKQRQERREGL